MITQEKNQCRPRLGNVNRQLFENVGLRYRYPNLHLNPIEKIPLDIYAEDKIV
jgi:hypothetical protein